jgi:hypothetical protein
MAMTEEEFIESMRLKYASLDKSSRSNRNFYDFEKEFDKIWTELGREVLEKSIGTIPGDHRLKKIPHQVREN